jgi:hypothetical protein
MSCLPLRATGSALAALLLAIAAAACTAAGEQSSELVVESPDAGVEDTDAGKPCHGEDPCTKPEPPDDECDHECGDGMCGAGEDCPADCKDHDNGDKDCDEAHECCGDDCEPEEPEEHAGCTRTQGYWKNHHEYATSPGLIGDWPAPHDEDDLLCGERLLDILHRPSKGDAWVILGRQYIAAILNVASGASTSDQVAQAIAEAEAWLTGHCGGVPTSQAPEAIALAETLDAYNHGLLGPAHCD